MGLVAPVGLVEFVLGGLDEVNGPTGSLTGSLTNGVGDLDGSDSLRREPVGRDRLTMGSLGDRFGQRPHITGVGGVVHELPDEAAAELVAVMHLGATTASPVLAMPRFHDFVNGLGERCERLR